MFIAFQSNFVKKIRHFRNDKGTEVEIPPSRKCFWDHYKALAGRQLAELGFL